MEKFKYDIHPRIPIKTLFDRVIFKSTTIELTADEVRECLKYGPVYRRFDGRHVERVTLDRVDELHRANFKDTPKVVKKEEPKDEEVKVEAPVEDKVEETVEETPVTEEVTEALVVEDQDEVFEDSTVLLEDHVEVTDEVEVIPEVVEEAPVETVVEDTHAVEEVAESEGTVEDLVPETPAEETIEDEEDVESSEEDETEEETEEASDDSQGQKPYTYSGKKKKRH